MSKNTSSGSGHFSLNRILYALCFLVLILTALIMILEIISINGRTILEIIHLGILKQIKELFLICAVALGAYPFAMSRKKGWRIAYWIIIILAFAIFVFGWVQPLGISF